MKESKSMMKKEIDFFKKKGAPKSMIKHEEAEMKSKKMSKPAKKSYASGGSASSRADGVAKRGKTKGTMIKMANGGKC